MIDEQARNGCAQGIEMAGFSGLTLDNSADVGLQDLALFVCGVRPSCANCIECGGVFLCNAARRDPYGGGAPFNQVNPETASGTI